MYGYVNKYGATAGSPVSSIPVTGVTLATGENVIVCVHWHTNGTTPTITGVSDGGLNTYAQIGSTFICGVGSAIQNDAFAMFYAKNVKAGSGLTIKATLSGNSTDSNNDIAVFRYTGLDPSASPPTFYASDQFAPGKGTDAVTTGLMAVANQPAMVFGINFDYFNGVGVISHGTGFTSRGNPVSGVDIIAEDKRVTSLANVAATFTNANVSETLTFGAIFPEPLPPTTTSTGSGGATTRLPQPDKRARAARTAARDARVEKINRWVAGKRKTPH